MPAVQRNGRSSLQTKSENTSHSVEMTPAASNAPRPSPYLLLIYPLILGAGSLYSILSPIAAAQPSTPLASGVTSGINAPSISPTNYFAGKHNILNVYFVKMGWFWTTLAILLLQATTRPPPANKRNHYVQAAIRYAVITGAWFLTTQWFFGPAIIDRSFTITGGHCEANPARMGGLEKAHDVEMINSSIHCKIAGGRWRGGHDMSGHVFMLVLSSWFLLYELYIADRHSSHPSVSPRAAATLAHDMTDEERKSVGGWESENVAKVRVWSRYFLYGVVVLDLWMLMMTAIWFHTWLEKLSGLLLAASTLWGVYFLPDFVPQWKAVVGGL